MHVFFLGETAFRRGVSLAMDGHEPEGLKGLRRKWRRTSDKLGVDTSNVSCLSEPDVIVSSAAAVGKPFGADYDFLDGTDLGFEPSHVPTDRQSEYEPSLASSFHHAGIPVDVGGRSSFRDDCAAVADTFIRGAKFSAVTMPWETPLMRQFFWDEYPGAKLCMPIDRAAQTCPSQKRLKLVLQPRSYLLRVIGSVHSMFSTKLMKRSFNRGRRPCMVR